MEISGLAELLAVEFAVIMACMIVLWLLSIAIDDVSFVDSFWAAGFVVLAGFGYWVTGAEGGGIKQLVLIVAAVWGTRLGLYIFVRWRKDGPDGRYVALKAKAKGNVHIYTLKNVFLIQGVMLWIVALPILFVMAGPTIMPLGLLAFVGVGLSTLGFFFESVGDWQMARFRSKPENKGKVMDQGLWRYTRHPNYFGDACVFWGLYLIALGAPYGYLSIFGPALLTWTLVKWSGAALLERRLSRSKPGYEDYLARTRSFIPWFPKNVKGRV
ncbi:DUF1295 domain-containing protein [Kordiimonas pumila]|uniref:DUF1295 domain-containing protein n=1 Tax=Kordiimonas pumila TaxID=2161677 RepID=A0ABV7D624_9PROT|nr:DUF1295 domain-containing protein [Kordiimonas pumila]